MSDVSKALEQVVASPYRLAWWDGADAVISAARHWDSFPSDEDVEIAVTTMPRWMWEGINEHVVNPEEVVRFVLQAIADARRTEEER